MFTTRNLQIGVDVKYFDLAFNGQNIHYGAKRLSEFIINIGTYIASCATVKCSKNFKYCLLQYQAEKSKKRGETVKPTQRGCRSFAAPSTWTIAKIKVTVPCSCTQQALLYGHNSLPFIPSIIRV